MVGNSRIRKIFLVIGVFWLGMVSNQSTQILLENPKTASDQVKDTFIFALEQGIPPFTMQGSLPNSVDGYGYDIAEWIAHEAKMTFEYQLLSWNDTLEQLASGDVDFTYMIDTPDRRETYNFSLPVLNFTTRIFVPEEERVITSIDELNGTTVLVVDDSVYQEYLETHVPGAYLIPVEDEATAIKLLNAGDARAAFVGEDSGWYTIQKEGYANLKMVGDPIILGELCIATLLGQNESPLTIINSAIQSAQAEHIFQGFREDYLGESVVLYSNPNLLYWIFGGIAMVGLVLGVMWIWNRTLKRKVQESNQSLRIQKEQLDVSLSNIEEGVILVDTRLKIRYFNHSARKLLHKTAEDLHNQVLPANFPIYEETTDQRIPITLPPEKIKITEHQFNQILHQIPTHAKLKVPNQRPIIIEISTSVLTGEMGGRSEYERGAVLVFRDVSEKRQKMLEDLRRQKIESLGVLAGGIAHDFNNLLTSILGNLSLIEMEISEGSSTYEMLHEAEIASQRARDLANQLLTFSKGGTPVKSIHNIVKIVKESVNFTIRGTKFVVNYKITPPIFHVEIDEGQISQVINNILINAMQAMEESSEYIIYIEIRNELITSPIRSELLPGEYVKISISDSGPGIPPHLHSKIFDPYFTTKPNGNGLGLAVCHSIIQKHNGFIKLNSKMGVGSTFSVYLPAVQASHEPIQESSIVANARHWPSRDVIILEDDPKVAALLKKMLSKVNCKVQWVDSSQKLLDIYKTHLDNGQPFDLVILDLVIPGDSGGDYVMEKLLEFDPEVTAIVTSGYAKGKIMSDYKSYGFKGVLPKPYQIKKVIKLLDSVFN